MVVPFIENDIIFINEYAAAIDDYMITFPKGKIDKGETIEEAANRELGLYSWEHLYSLCKNYQENWHNYLERLKEAGHTRKKP